MTKPILRYGRRGWFSIIRFASGTSVLTADRKIIRVPDEYGCFTRELVVGPYGSAREAAAASL